MKNDFYEEYPSDLYNRIKEDGASDLTIENVYRISYEGNNDCKAFESSFFSKKESNRDKFLEGTNNKNDEYDIGKFSTSMISQRKKAEQTFKMFQKYHNGPAILKGTILPEYGPSIFTKDSKLNRDYRSKYHIDWWLYKDADPSEHFEIFLKKGE